MTLDQDIEILKSIKSARENRTRAYWSGLQINLFCPVCGTDLPSYDDIINRQKTIFCRRCAMDYIISIRPHSDTNQPPKLKDATPKLPEVIE